MSVYTEAAPISQRKISALLMAGGVLAALAAVGLAVWIIDFDGLSDAHDKIDSLTAPDQNVQDDLERHRHFSL